MATWCSGSYRSDWVESGFGGSSNYVSQLLLKGIMFEGVNQAMMKQDQAMAFILRHCNIREKK